MKKTFDNLSMAVSRKTTHAYSTSFSLGIYLLDKRLRDAIYSIYGFVRLADEIVDSFEGYNKQELLGKFRVETKSAIADRISLNMILNAFQETVHKYNIGMDLIDGFLKSMEMDLDKIQYSRKEYDQYILGSAEVVGLMCLRVFTERNEDKYEELRPFAMKLGAAFQKVNFLRDLKHDYEVLGRVYFPTVNMQEFTTEVKFQIEQEIANDFRIALHGIKKLPSSSRAGVYVAYVYYNSLFKKIRRLPPHRIFTERVRINNGMKLGLMLNGIVQSRIGLKFEV